MVNRIYFLKKIQGVKMKKAGINFLITNFMFIIFSISCKREVGKSANIINSFSFINDVDTKTIESKTGCSFKILKTETQGYIPLHKF